MVQPGDVIENPATGERITFVRTSAQTGGACAEMDLELSPSAHLAAEHIHLRQGGARRRQGDALTARQRPAGLAHDLHLAGPPVPLQRVAFRVLTGAARLLHRA